MATIIRQQPSVPSCISTTLVTQLSHVGVRTDVQIHAIATVATGWGNLDGAPWKKTVPMTRNDERMPIASTSHR